MRTTLSLCKNLNVPKPKRTKHWSELWGSSLLHIYTYTYTHIQYIYIHIYTYCTCIVKHTRFLQYRHHCYGYQHFREESNVQESSSLCFKALNRQVPAYVTDFLHAHCPSGTPLTTSDKLLLSIPQRCLRKQSPQAFFYRGPNCGKEPYRYSLL